MKAKLHYVLATTIFLITFSLFGQKPLWKKIENTTNLTEISKFNIDKNKAHFFKLDLSLLKETISSATLRHSKVKKSATVITIPIESGKLETFKIYEASVFSPSLASKYPDIKSYSGVSTTNSGNHLRMSVSHKGIQAMISGIDKPNIFIQSIENTNNTYILYNRDSKIDYTNPFKCQTLDHLNSTYQKSISKIDEGGANTKTLQTFRIAVSVTGEYTDYHGGSVADALAGINATLNRVNEIFETDMGVTFELVDATQLIYTNASTDPYSNANTGVEGIWSTELQNTLTTSIGENTYDIGHLFGASGGGGNAGCIGCVCIDGLKGSAFTSPSSNTPEGDSFDINFVVHEIGHQMGANHTWAFESEGTNVQSEPGSGSTIMAYAGITDLDDIQLNSDPYFHYQSIKQILNNLETKTCQTKTAISNNPPNANAGNNFTIPQGTPYILKGSASDTNNDNLTYCWEQIDNGVVNSDNFGSTLTSGSINRSLSPTSLSDRYIPNLNNVLNGQLTESNPVVGSSWESVSSVSRDLNWALTVRDRTPGLVTANGQTSFDTTIINVDGNSGPFAITSQNTSNINWTPGTTETITWNVANTNSGTINTSNVNILLSTDGGLTFPNILSGNTPNDGTENILVPFISEPYCRIKIEPVDNIYYAINSAVFAINFTVVTNCPASYNSPLNLNLDFDELNSITNVINVPDGGTISDLKVTMDVSHTYIDDVIVKLTHPNGTTSVNLWNRNCLDESDIVITFEDWTDNINCNNTGSGNTYKPSDLLSAFNGLDAAGTWQISLEDLVSQDDGVLNSWSLNICTQSTSLTNPNFLDEIDGIKVYPNPNTGNFNIAFNSTSNKNIFILISDMRGRIVSQIEYPSSSVFREEVKLNGIQSGMYIVQISDGAFSTKKKIIIK